MVQIKENTDMRLIMAQEKREELESTLRRKHEELAKKKEDELIQKDEVYGVQTRVSMYQSNEGGETLNEEIQDKVNALQKIPMVLGQVKKENRQSYTNVNPQIMSMVDPLKLNSKQDPLSTSLHHVSSVLPQGLVTSEVSYKKLDTSQFESMVVN